MARKTFATVSAVSSTYGAPMGRRDDRCAPESFTVYRVRLDEGGYDDGGAYWGGGEPLYQLSGADADGNIWEQYTRAPHIMAAYTRAAAEYEDAQGTPPTPEAIARDLAYTLAPHILAGVLWVADDEDGVPYTSHPAQDLHLFAAEAWKTARRVAADCIAALTLPAVLQILETETAATLGHYLSLPGYGLEQPGGDDMAEVWDAAAPKLPNDFQVWKARGGKLHFEKC